MGDITWLPFSMDVLCIAAVSKSPLPIISGHHIFPVPVTSIICTCTYTVYSTIIHYNRALGCCKKCKSCC